jgi:hypothetical protein
LRRAFWWRLMDPGSLVDAPLWLGWDRVSLSLPMLGGGGFGLSDQGAASWLLAGAPRNLTAQRARLRIDGHQLVDQEAVWAKAIHRAPPRASAPSRRSTRRSRGSSRSWRSERSACLDAHGHRGRPAGCPRPAPVRQRPSAVAVALALRAPRSVHEPATRPIVAECAPIGSPGSTHPAPCAVSWTGGEEPVAVAIVKPEHVAAVVEPEALHLAMSRLVPARERGMAEPAGPRLRPQVPPVVIVTHHFGAITQDDAEAERGPRIPVRHIRPVRLSRRLANRQGAEGGREQKVPTHGCLPTSFRKRASSLHHVV